MITSVLKGRTLAAVAGVAMLAATATSASAFTLSSPSLEPSVAGSNVEHVWYHHGWGYGGWHHGWGYGGWHGGWGYGGWPHGWGGWGYGGWRHGWGGWGYGGWHHRHCWVNPWGHLRCAW
jgi:hypothetical protein